MHASHMTRRTFLKGSSLAAGVLAAGSVAACGTEETDTVTSQESAATQETTVREIPVDPEAAVEGEIAPAHHVDHKGSGSKVLFSHNVDADVLTQIYDALDKKLEGSKVAVKISSGEPGSNSLAPELIAALVSHVNGTIVECNTAYDGPRRETASHYEVAAEHGYTKIADFQIMDEDGSLGLPVEGGIHLTENLVGAHFTDYDAFLILSHFKGHQMAGFGGALKNMSIGIASATGKFRIHTAGRNDSGWSPSSTATFQEAMADACKSVIDALGGNVVYINVMNRLSIDCDCSDEPAEPKMADVGILASTDPVAVDQACIDLIYDSDDDSTDLLSRIETLNGEHVLEAAEQIGIGSRAYELVELV